MIAILDYGAGNVMSIAKMIQRAGGQSVITSDLNVLENADKIILPGVGNFSFCMKSFLESGLNNELRNQVLVKGKTLLGICVGHQMLFEYSEEGDIEGLGWIPGKVVKFSFNDKDQKRLKIPHMAWTDTTPMRPSPLFKEMAELRFYYVHSYHAVCDEKYVLATANYGYDFVSGVQSGNIIGVQFHPEKSHKYGMKLLENFIKYY